MYIVQVYGFYIPKFKTRLHFNMSRFIKVIYLLLFYLQNAHQIFEQSQFKEIIKEKHQRNFFFPSYSFVHKMFHRHNAIMFSLFIIVIQTWANNL